MGSVSKLQILNASSDVLRVTWVGVTGATAYRLAWGRTEGMVPCPCPYPSWLGLPFLVNHPHPDRCPMLAWPGGPTRQQILPGNTDSAEIRGLDGGVSYSVRVTALVGDREGAPVSIVVTTRRRSLGWGESWIGLHGLGAGFVLCG